MVHTPIPVYCIPFLLRKSITNQNGPSALALRSHSPLSLLSLCSDGLGGINVLVPLGGAALSLALFSAVEGFPDTDNTARPLLLWTGTITHLLKKHLELLFITSTSVFSVANYPRW